MSSSRSEDTPLTSGAGAVGAHAASSAGDQPRVCRERERESQRHAFRGGNLSLFVFFPFLFLLLLLFFCASTACRRLRHRRAQPARLQLPVVPQTGGGESTCRRAERTHLGMDALKSAGRAIIKSPGVPRHTWGTSKHESE